MKLYTLEFAFFNIFHIGKSKPSVQRRCFCACFILWFIVAFILNVYILYYELMTPSVGITGSFTFLASFVFRIIAYFVLWLKRKQLLQLCMIMKKINRKVRSEAFFFLNMLHILNVITFLFFPALCFYVKYAIDVFRNTFPKSFEGMLHMYINEYAFVFNQITLPVFVTLIHSSIYLWCSTTLKNTKQKIKESNMHLNNNRIISVLQLFQSILRVAASIENTFSTVAFFSLTSYLISAFLSVTPLLYSSSYDNMPATFHAYVNFFFNVLGLTILIAGASETPMILEKIKLSLILLDEKLSLLGTSKKSQKIKIIIDALLKRDVIAFSACNIVHFKRSAIIACYGTLITYGLLLYSTEKSFEN